MSEIKHPRSGEPLLPEVYADPGIRGWYYREKMPDSMASYVPSTQVTALQAKVARLEAALGEAVTALEHVLAGKPVRNADEIIARQALKETTDE